MPPQVGVKRKILVLHGYTTNAYMASRALASTIADCDKDLEFYFLDAPTVLLPVDSAHELGTPAAVTPAPIPFPVCSEPSLSPAYSSTPRCWFKIDHWHGGQESMPGIEDTFELIHKALSTNQFEGIFGFSQGAAVAELITAMLERPRLYPWFCKNGQAPHPPMRFIVAISGYLLRGVLAAPGASTSSIVHRYPSVMIHTPVLHVIGRTDVVVARERSNLFIGFSKNKRVEEHIGGHFIPSGPQWRQFFSEFFRDPFGDIASPSPPVKDEEQYFLPPAEEYAIRNFSIGRTLPLWSMEYEDEDEGMSDCSETLWSSSGRSGNMTPTSAGYCSPQEQEMSMSTAIEWFSYFSKQ